MANSHKIFSLESRIEDMFEELFPKDSRAHGLHKSGRAFKPILESAIGGLVPGGNKSRQLQFNRDYYKIDFQDFLDFATAETHPTPPISSYIDQKAVFYEQIALPNSGKKDVHATWNSGEKTYGISIIDAVIARDRIFVSVLMRFSLLSLDKNESAEISHIKHAIVDGAEDEDRAEYGATLIFAPASLAKDDSKMGPLSEWERAMWWPPVPGDDQWRFVLSGEFTSHVIDKAENDKAQNWISPDGIAKVREQADENHTLYGVYFEIARLGLLLPKYVNFMYDLMVTEEKSVGRVRDSKIPKRKSLNAKPISRVVYKIIHSIRVIRPTHKSSSETFRQWVAPSYCFLVRGHWRNLTEPNKVGRDAEGRPVVGKTWVRDFHKYKHKDQIDGAEQRIRNPSIIVGIKQTLSHARDIINSNNQLNPATQIGQFDSGEPSKEWKANERAKLNAALRYLVLKRDGFKCSLCGKNASDENFVKLEVDHIIPVSKWGKTEESNLRTICRDCNRGKADQLP